MAETHQAVVAPLLAEGGAQIGEIDSFTVVRDGAQRWLVLTGTVEDETRGAVAFLSRIPIAEGWTMVQLHGH